MKNNYTTRDLLILLHNGYVLKNITGGIVVLDEQGSQQIRQAQNYPRTKPYKFSNPEYWEILGVRKGHLPTLWEKIVYFVSSKIL